MNRIATIIGTTLVYLTLTMSAVAHSPEPTWTSTTSPTASSPTSEPTGTPAASATASVTSGPSQSPDQSEIPQPSGDSSSGPTPTASISPVPTGSIATPTETTNIPTAPPTSVVEVNLIEDSNAILAFFIILFPGLMAFLALVVRPRVRR